MHRWNAAVQEVGLFVSGKGESGDVVLGGDGPEYGLAKSVLWYRKSRTACSRNSPPPPSRRETGPRERWMTKSTFELLAGS